MAHPLPADAVSRLCDALRSQLRPDQLSTSHVDRIAYARDQWPRSLLKLRQGALETPPDLIIWPESPQEAADALATCRAQQRHINAVAAGGGSSVTGASSPQRGGAVIDLKRLDRVRWIDLERGLAEIEAGMLGMHLEEALNRAGATLGHFPSSIMCSTLGGWAAARSAGQGSSRYGKIEDMIEDIELATVTQGEGEPQGKVGWIRGIYDPTPLVVGSEGRLGLITACRVRIHPAPIARRFRGVLLPGVEAGLEAIKAMMQSGDVPPTILRLYDPIDTALSSHRRVKDDPQHQPPRRSDGVRLPSSTSKALIKAPEQPSKPWERVGEALTRGLRSVAKPVVSQALMRAGASMGLLDVVMPDACLMILGCEGHSEEAAEALLKRHLQRCLKAGGEDLGAAPGWHWFDGRYNVSFKQSLVFNEGAFVDTMEVVARWPQVGPLYHGVRDAIGQDAVVMAHFSHAYPEGCSIYFSFVAMAPPSAELGTYDGIWQRGLTAAAALGAGGSHHHGIGFSKAHVMEQEWSKGGLKLMRALREAYDPDNQLNPGKLALDPPAAPAPTTPTTPRSDAPEAACQGLEEATPHLPWAAHTLMTPQESWARYGNPACTFRQTLTLHSWHDVQTLLRHNQGHQVPLYSSDGPLPSRPGLRLDLPLPTHSPPAFQLDEAAMLLTCDSRFSLEAIESYARMAGFTTGLRGDLNSSLLQWIDRGHEYAVNVRGTQGPLPVYGLVALLPSGEEVQLGRGPRASSGPDIRHLFWRTGGAFGIIKRATLRLRRVSEDVQVWRTTHPQLSDAIDLLRDLFRLHQPPLGLSLWHALPDGPSRLTVRFCPEQSPALIERYQHIAKIQEMSALPSPPLPSTSWWLAVAGQWPDLADIAGYPRREAPWPMLRIHLAQAYHEGGVWLVSFSPAVPPQTPAKGFGAFVKRLSQHQAVKGIWGDPRFVHMPDLDPHNASILRRVKRRVDPHDLLNPHALSSTDGPEVNP